ncbi:glycosyltransferase family 2 protein [Synechococcus sp. Cruz-9H2]|uniref:glycosyltransferase family 2 protein n=1 Tax=unclassified Synechococcus TaxID=2626047 RepID=UPI0020CE19A3|nr:MULTISPECIES: glycosyltransferase family 2 protein [unclassified Synechococcus]MCP9820637.1 glycosyltransferase family 2 protein [Synechococcus sp. Cruz-9H2]MCP9844854.1 glycosyltransferase family 2 protein [Synechococcus sp. Edmonson 11F2]MCP9856975.1 glycosyltransferase family 2 protein [Synechococcus sp. Cruz-9C9]MCP9864262.1 glycosyltransferase family 2 protein [Synechococcus sp. Cruz-7E5]MCP9871530.1 glycosyltransferase family 2 protein [Synechococcus sp. Cruz-7B9]
MINALIEPLVEVRIPTYRRPEMLIDALQSLLRQTHQRWLAIVFDDSPDCEAKGIVRSLDDPRISYASNRTRLGAAGNINQCFNPSPLCHEASYFFCLEDDNLIQPQFIELNIVALRESGCAVMMRNQRIFARRSSGHVVVDGTTLGPWFSVTGVYSSLELCARTFFYTGVSNGALFWSRTSRSVLYDRFSVTDPSLQEYVRCWGLSEDIYIDLAPQALYHLPEQPTDRHYTTDKSFSRGIQSAHRALVRTYGARLVCEVVKLGRLYGQEQQSYRGLSNLASFRVSWLIVRCGGRIILKAFLRGLIKRVFIASPLRLYPD